MRVHVISDMEAVSGIVKWQQVTGGKQRAADPGPARAGADRAGCEEGARRG